MPSSSLQLNMKHSGVPSEETTYNVVPAGDGDYKAELSEQGNTVSEGERLTNSSPS